MVTRPRSFALITLREIRRAPGRFISIFLIVLLGSGFFAGMRATCPDMKKSCDAYLDAHNCEDLSVVSLIGFTQAELDRISRLSCVERLSGGYRFDALMTKAAAGGAGSSADVSGADDGSPVVVLSLSNRPSPGDIDAARLVEGRLPERSGECLAETGRGGRRPARIGEVLRLASAYGERDFTVTGIGQSPLYISFERGSNSLGSGTTESYFMLREDDAYDLALPKLSWPRGFSTSRYYTEARITLKGARALDSFGPEYKRLVASAKAEIRGLAVSRLGSDRYWQVGDRADNVGIQGFASDAERVGNLGKVFPAVFFLVAALVSLTAMTRLIEEKRGEIGTLKALGYGSPAIVGQYFLYAAAATLGGGAAGVLIGFPLLPKLIYSMYRLMYDVGPLSTFYSFSLAAEAVLLAFLCTGGATALAGARELTAVPAALMRPRAPAPGKRVLLERITFIWGRLGFLQKVTARNIFRYKRRFWMSVVGIAGCAGLLLAGFGMNDSLSALTGLQFGQIYHYDALSAFRAETEDQRSELLSSVRSAPGVAKASVLSLQGCVLRRSASRGAGKGQERGFDGYIIVPEEPAALGDYITLRDGPRPLSLGDDGVVLTRKAAILLRLQAGDDIEIESAGQRARLRVAAVTDQYVMHFAYLSPAAYEKAFGSPPTYNQVVSIESFGHAKGEGGKASAEAQLGRRLLSIPGIARVSFTSADTKLWEDTMGNMRYIIAVIIIAAGLLSLIVIYTLTSINITERSKELATIKVLGFREGEVAQYVYRENTILAAIGIAAGLVFGVFLHREVVLTTEVEVCLFSRSIAPLSFLYSFLCCSFFAFAANLLMYRRIKRIDMVEAMKSVE